MENLIINNRQCIGDLVVLSAVVRDLQLAHPNVFNIKIGHTKGGPVFKNNPYLTSDRLNSFNTKKEVQLHMTPKKWEEDVFCGVRDMKHLIEFMADDLSEFLEIDIPITKIKPDLHLTDEEKVPTFDFPYWVVFAGGKYDHTCKWWHTSNFQKVVDMMPETKFVQMGGKNDFHIPLNNCINMIGKTNVREMMQIIFNAKGIVCPITSAMHIAGAFEKPCVVLGGGRETPEMIKYPNHNFLSVVGKLNCCKIGGCWLSRIDKINNSRLKKEYQKDLNKRLCECVVHRPVHSVSLCMDVITPEMVVQAIKDY